MATVDINEVQVPCSMPFCSWTEEHSAEHGIRMYGGEEASGGSLADRFIDLVRKNCLMERRLEFYSRQLNVSVKYLSNVVTKSTGRKAGMWIVDQLICEAKMMLTDSNVPIHAMAEQLGFETSTEFCRYFRTHTGMPPGKFRKHVLGQSQDNCVPLKAQ